MGKIIQLEEGINIRRKAKEEKKKVVFTNGCFDIIHRGHIEVLEKAKSFGDILIVGLNSDRSVRKIKGEKRPIMNENDRAVILCSLIFVDYVLFFDEPTPEGLINALKPDILVKGGDYKKEEIVGREIVEKQGGKVIIVRLFGNYSTSSLIQKIKTLNH